MKKRLAENPAELLVVWFLAACAAGAWGVVSGLQPPLPQIMVAGLTVLFGLVLWIVPGYRRWSGTVPLKGLVALHVTRLMAGSAFLWEMKQGRLSPVFALPAGWGDIAVATGALVLLAAFSPGELSGRYWYGIWNFLGLADILGVVVLAAKTALADPGMMRPLLELPLSLLPTFLVPVIIVSHVLLFLRLRA